MQLQHEFGMAEIIVRDVISQPTRRYRAYLEMLAELKKERNEDAE